MEWRPLHFDPQNKKDVPSLSQNSLCLHTISVDYFRFCFHGKSEHFGLYIELEIIVNFTLNIYFMMKLLILGVYRQVKTKFGLLVLTSF